MQVGIIKSSLVRTSSGAQSQWTLYPSGKSTSVRKGLLPTDIVANVEDSLALTCRVRCRYHVGERRCTQISSMAESVWRQMVLLGNR